MSKTVVLCPGIWAMLLAIVTCTPRAVAQSQTPDECPGQQQIVAELLSGINAIRAEPRQCGAVPYPAAPQLAWNDVLFRVADQHVADMGRRGYFSHDTPEGLTPAKRATIAGYQWSHHGENLSAGPTTVEDVLNTWLNSSMHCQVMMTEEFRDVALACAAANGKLLWALELGLVRQYR